MNTAFLQRAAQVNELNQSTDNSLAKTLDSNDRPKLSDTFSWIRNPASGLPPKDLSEVISRANDYFTLCDDAETFPTLTGLTLALGLPSVSSIHRLGVKKPETRYSLGRCLTAISYHYEMGMATGDIKSTVSTFMLKHLNAFDDEDPVGSAPARFWSDKQEVEIHVDGYVEHKVENLSAEETYFKLLNGESISTATLEHAIEDVECEPAGQLAPVPVDEVENDD